ncbi:hypothetical protein ACFV9W_24575 [Streptomyces sp. NPDC059897]|uniref:hypothetical protein n=1 Tax=Streptomyces sp. NPDC059897 TaxID=3346994 RepID=UPI003647260A
MSIREPDANHSGASHERFRLLPVDDVDLAVEHERLSVELQRVVDEVRPLSDALLRGEERVGLWDERKQKRDAQKQLEAQLAQLVQWMRLNPEQRRHERAERRQLEERERLAAERERAVKYEQIMGKWPPVAGEWEESLEVEEEDDYSGSDAVAIDLGGSVTVLICAWIVAPYAQGLAGQAATGTYRAFANKLIDVLANRRQSGGRRWDLVVLRTPDGKLTVQIPGDLPEEVHAALVRDFVDIVDKAADGERIDLSWDERTRSWINRNS